MVISGIIILICLFLAFFTLYVLSREDFVFLRKNISVEEIFDVAFLTVIISLFFSRLFFVIDNFALSYFNPLVFFLIPYFPGLSLLGAIGGYVLAVLVITKQKKYPRGRFVDFFAVAILSVMPLGYAGFLLTSPKGSLIFSILPIFYYAILFLFYWKILLPRFLQGQIRDGTLGILFLMNYSLFTVLLSIIQAIKEKTPPITFTTGSLIFLFLLSLFFYFKQGAQLSLRKGK